MVVSLSKRSKSGGRERMDHAVHGFVLRRGQMCGTSPVFFEQLRTDIDGCTVEDTNNLWRGRVRPYDLRHPVELVLICVARGFTAVIPPCNRRWISADIAHKTAAAVGTCNNVGSFGIGRCRLSARPLQVGTDVFIAGGVSQVHAAIIRATEFALEVIASGRFLSLQISRLQRLPRLRWAYA